MRRWLLLIVLQLIALPLLAQVDLVTYEGLGVGETTGPTPTINGSLGVDAVWRSQYLFSGIASGTVTSDAHTFGDVRLTAEKLFLHAGEGLGVGGGFDMQGSLLAEASMITDEGVLSAYAILPTDEARTAGGRGEASLSLGKIVLAPWLEVTNRYHSLGVEVRIRQFWKVR